MSAFIRWYDGAQWNPPGYVLVNDPTPGTATEAWSVQSTTTTLTTSATSVNSGSTVTLTATVKTVSGTSVTTGSVIFEYLNGATWTAIVTDAASPWTTSPTVTADRTYRARYLGTATYLASTSATKAVDCKVLTTYTKTYYATWSASYRSSGAKRTDVSEIYQGYYSSTNGNQEALVGFDYAQIQADTSGATITACSVYLYYSHWYSSSGGTAVIGTHNYTSAPGSSPVTNDDRVRNSYSGTGAETTSLGTTIGNEFKAGTSKGICIGPGPSTSSTYYGYAQGNGQSSEPRLIITYTKYV